MEVLRENRESLMAVLEAFVYDPLLAWRLTATNQPGGRVTDEKEMAEDGVNARQRKSKANEADVLGGESDTMFQSPHKAIRRNPIGRIRSWSCIDE
jgi:FKBP12-rapamycin complex-associated protein